MGGFSLTKKSPRARLIVRAGLALYLLLAGVSMLPHAGITAERLGWEEYAGIYQPQLALLGKGSGAPGSAFRFSAAGFPPNAWATVYVDGVSSGPVRINSQGELAFLVQSKASAVPDSYLITLAVDSNVSATAKLTLDPGEPIVVAPNRWSGPVVPLEPGPAGGAYLPD